MVPIRRSPQLVAFVVALGLRLYFLIHFSGSPFFEPVNGGSDRFLYQSVGRQVAEGQFFPESVLSYLPLYGWTTGFLYRFGASVGLWLAGLAGCFLDAWTAFLVVKLARRFGATDGFALAGGLIYAVYPVAVVYSVLTMPNTLNAFLFTACSACFAKLSEKSKSRTWFLAGLLAGTACLGFAGMLLTVAAIAVWWLATRTAPVSRLALFLLGVSLPIAPVTLHNLRVGGEPVLLTGHGGFNFYLGNHRGATGYPVQVGDFRGDAGGMLADARHEAESASGRPLTDREVSRYWSEKAWEFIRSEPIAAARLMVLKALRFFNRHDYDDLRIVNLVHVSGVSGAGAPWLDFLPIGVLGLMGLLLARGAGAGRVAAAAGALSIILFFVTARYRLTLAPLFCALGAGAAREFLPRPRPMALAALIGAVAVVAWPMKRPDFRALDHYHAAAYLLEQGDAESARVQADRGLEIAPEDGRLHFVRGNALFGLNRLDEAAAAFREAIRLRPADAQPHFNLAVVLKHQGDPDGARAEAEQALALDPSFEMARVFLREMGR